MSSKLRKSGPSRPPTRGRGNRQASHGFSRPQQSKDYSNGSAGRNQDPVVPEYNNPLIAASILPLVGCHVQVQTTSNEIYDGVLYTVSPEFVVCLTSAHLKSSVSQKQQEHCNTPNKEELIRISVDLKDIICIKCNNVDLDYAKKGSFLTDSMIAGCNGPNNTERELEPWQPEGDIHSVGTLADMSEIVNGDAYVELKKANEEKFEYKTSFDEAAMSKYQDEIETNDKEKFYERERSARRLVAEIEKQSSHSQHEELDSGQSEEEKYSSVKRSGSHSSRNPLPAMHGRGRPRGQAAANSYNREQANEHVALADANYNNRHAAAITNRRIPGSDEHPRLFSELFRNPGPQPEAPNQHGQMNNGGQQQRMPYPAAQRPRMHNDPSHMQQQKVQTGMHHAAVHYHQVQMAQPASKANAELQPGSPSSARDQQSPSVHSEKDIKKNRDMLINSAQGGSAERSGPDSSVECRSPSAVDMAKPSTDVSKHKEDLFKDAKGAPRQKFGKVQQQQEEKAPADIGKLKLFGANFKLEDKPQRRQKEAADVKRGQQKEPEKPDNESVIILVSPDPPAKAEKFDDKQEQNERAADATNKENTAPKNEERDAGKPLKNGMEAEQRPASTADERRPGDVAVQSAVATPTTRKESSLNPDAKEFKLNPNAKEFLPPPAAAQPRSSPCQILPTGVRHVPTSSPPVIHGNMPANPAIQGMRVAAYPLEQVGEGPTPSATAMYSTNIIQQQQQPSAPQQFYYVVNQQQQQQHVVSTIPPQPHGLVRYHQPQQARLGHQFFAQPLRDNNSGVFIVNPSGNPILAHQQQQQQQQQQIHGTYAHGSSQPQQQPQQPIHYMVQHMPQMTSPMQSTPQGAPVPHPLPRPPTPSQHAVHSATPPIHPGMFLQANQMPPASMQHSSFVGAPHGQPMHYQ